MRMLLSGAAGRGAVRRRRLLTSRSERISTHAEASEATTVAPVRARTQGWLHSRPTEELIAE